VYSFKQALEISRKINGEFHDETARCYNGTCLFSVSPNNISRLGYRCQEEEELFGCRRNDQNGSSNQATNLRYPSTYFLYFLSTFEGDTHMLVSQTLNNLGNIFGKEAKYEEALQSYEEAGAIIKVKLY